MSSLIKTILVPFDFSSFSKAAVSTAISFARELQASVLLLHVVDVLDYGSFNLLDESQGDSYQVLTEKIASKTLSQFVKSLDHQGVDIKSKVCVGHVHHKIIEESDSIAADLIVMGTHGASGMDNLLGSTTRRMIRTSQAPVLTIHEELRFESIKRIAFASSFNQEYTFSFPTIYQFMELFRAELFLVKVVTPADFEATYYSRKIMDDFAREFLIKDYRIQVVNAPSVEDGLDWFCSDADIDLLFMTTHGRKGPARLITKSHTESTGQHSGCPVLSIRMMKVKQRKGVIFPD